MKSDIMIYCLLRYSIFLKRETGGREKGERKKREREKERERESMMNTYEK